MSRSVWTRTSIVAGAAAALVMGMPSVSAYADDGHNGDSHSRHDHNFCDNHGNDWWRNRDCCDHHHGHDWWNNNGGDWWRHRHCDFRDHHNEGHHHNNRDHHNHGNNHGDSKVFFNVG